MKTRWEDGGSPSRVPPVMGLSSGVECQLLLQFQQHNKTESLNKCTIIVFDSFAVVVFSIPGTDSSYLQMTALNASQSGLSRFQVSFVCW